MSISNKDVVAKIVNLVLKSKLNSSNCDDDLVDACGMDSMARIEIVTEIEKQFNVSIDDVAALKLRSVNNFCSAIDELKK